MHNVPVNSKASWMKVASICVKSTAAVLVMKAVMVLTAMSLAMKKVPTAGKMWAMVNAIASCLATVVMDLLDGMSVLTIPCVKADLLAVM